MTKETICFNISSLCSNRSLDELYLIPIHSQLSSSCSIEISFIPITHWVSLYLLFIHLWKSERVQVFCFIHIGQLSIIMVAICSFFPIRRVKDNWISFIYNKLIDNYIIILLNFLFRLLYFTISFLNRNGFSIYYTLGDNVVFS